MKKIIQLLCCLSLIFSIESRAVDIDVIHFMTQDYAPYHFKDEKGNPVGIIIDLMGQLMKEVGSKQTIQDIEFMPWAHAINNAKTIENTAIFSYGKTEERKPLFKWVGPLAPVKIVLLAKKSSNIKINSAKELSNYVVGVNRSGQAQELLLKVGLTSSKLLPVANEKENVKNLMKGQTELISLNNEVAYWLIKNNGGNVSDYEEVFLLNETELSLAFNKNVNDEIITKYQTALDKLRTKDSSGKSIYDNIVAKYLTYK